MITSLILWLMGKGLTEKWARRLVMAVGVVAAFSACVALKTCYEHRIISDHEKTVAVDSLNEKIKADEKATVQREKDREADQKAATERKDAINESTDSVPNDSSLALGCTRLRQQGYKTDQFPECSGR